MLLFVMFVLHRNRSLVFLGHKTSLYTYTATLYINLPNISCHALLRIMVPIESVACKIKLVIGVLTANKNILWVGVSFCFLCIATLPLATALTKVAHLSSLYCIELYTRF